MGPTLSTWRRTRTGAHPLAGSKLAEEGCPSKRELWTFYSLIAIIAVHYLMTGQPPASFEQGPRRGQIGRVRAGTMPKAWKATNTFLLLRQPAIADILLLNLKFDRRFWAGY